MNFTKVFAALTRAENVSFVLNDEPISQEEVFADIGLLPAIVRRADKLCLLCLGYGIGITFVDAEQSRLGTRVQFDEVTPNTLRLMYIYDVIMELVEASSSRDKVSLDELMYD